MFLANESKKFSQLPNILFALVITNLLRFYRKYILIFEPSCIVLSWDLYVIDTNCILHKNKNPLKLSEGFTFCIVIVVNPPIIYADTLAFPEAHK